MWNKNFEELLKEEHPCEEHLKNFQKIFLDPITGTDKTNTFNGSKLDVSYLDGDYPDSKSTTLYFEGSSSDDLLYEYSSSTAQTCGMPVSSKDFQHLWCRVLRYKEECSNMLDRTWNELPKNETYCRGEFDGYICWPHGRPGLVHEKCPSFLDWSNDSLRGYRYCLNNGSWFQRPDPNGGMTIWNHRGECNPLSQSESVTNAVEAEQDIFDENLLNVLRIVYTTGYAISLACLLIALVLLLFFKRLHCTRNYIHMNLMLSFIIRYTAVIINDKVVDDHYDTSYFDPAEMSQHCDEYDGVSGLMITCRLGLALMYYAILANYFWLLVEGIYLLMLLVFTMSDYKFFPAFMALGWGFPWIPVGIWMALHLWLDNDGCWETDVNTNIIWSLKGPIVATIGVNFLIFINVLRIIVSKLRSNNMTKNDYKYRLARSTLALIPLLGIHYMVFLFVIDDSISQGNVVKKVQIAFEMVFTSIQGTLISVLYCFLNGEVKSEVKKFVHKWRLKHGLPSVTSQKCSTYQSHATQVASMISGNSADHNTNTDNVLLSPTDTRHSSITSGRSSMTYTSGEQTEGSCHPLIVNSDNLSGGRHQDEMV